MPTESSPLSGPSMLAILRGAFDAIRASPVILGLFLVSGLLRFVLSPLAEVVVRILLLLVGVVVAYRALGGQIRTDSPFLLRLFMGFLATLASLLLVIMGLLALLLPGILRWMAFFVLVLPGLYVYLRLFLSAPAAMVDGYGPAEALSASLRLMNGSVLATAFALVLVIVGVIAVLIPMTFLARSSLILAIGTTLVVDTLVAGMQSFLYTESAELP